MIKPELSERDARVERTRRALAEARFDALLVAGKGHWWTGRGYLRYFTDFHLWGHDGLLLLPLASDPILTLSSPAVAARIAARGWVTDTRGDVFIVPRMVEAIKEKGLASARIGIGGFRFVLGAGSYEALRQGLPDVVFVDADELIDRIRMVKSPLEIAQERELWRIAKSAMTAFERAIAGARGVSQREFAAEIAKPVWTTGARDMLVFISETAGAMVPPEPVPLRCNDKVRFHLEICGESGHWCEITVSCAFQPPHPEESKLLDDELLAFEETRKIARPGARLSDLAAAFNRVLRDQGWDLGRATTHFHFHGQGMDTIERPWFAEQAPWGQAADWPLEAGMVFSYHPHRDVLPRGRWNSGLNEDILITDAGAERLSVDWNHHWRMVNR